MISITHAEITDTGRVTPVALSVLWQGEVCTVHVRDAGNNTMLTFRLSEQSRRELIRQVEGRSGPDA